MLTAGLIFRACFNSHCLLFLVRLDLQGFVSVECDGFQLGFGELLLRHFGLLRDLSIHSFGSFRILGDLLLFPFSFQLSDLIFNLKFFVGLELLKVLYLGGVVQPIFRNKV